MDFSDIRITVESIQRAKFCLNLCGADYLDRNPTGQCRQTGAEFNIHLQHDSTAYVVYRGTQPNSLQDWASNLMIGPMRGQDPHWGWFVAYKSVEYSLRKHLEDLRIVRLCHVGHSRGGSIAQIAADRLGGTCVTFGAPPAFRGNPHRRPGEGWVTYTDPVPGLTNYIGFSSSVQQIRLKYKNRTLSPIEGHYLSAYRHALDSIPV